MPLSNTTIRSLSASAILKSCNPYPGRVFKPCPFTVHAGMFSLSIFKPCATKNGFLAFRQTKLKFYVHLVVLFFPFKILAALVVFTFISS